MTRLPGFHNVDSDESEVLPQDERKGTKIAQHAIPQSMIQKRLGGAPTKTESVQEPAASNAVNGASIGLKEREQIKRTEAWFAKIRAVQEEARKRCVQKSKEEVDSIIRKKIRKRDHSGPFDKEHDSEDSEQAMVIPKAGKQKRRNKKVKLET
ncbi:MAG: hypothetical protein M1830_007521 [Pleopsidium flavum]|nr:MAG: hypothetical protein M1830_007521 [Pleopsidium flavum]